MLIFKNVYKTHMEEGFMAIRKGIFNDEKVPNLEYFKN